MTSRDDVPRARRVSRRRMSILFAAGATLVVSGAAWSATHARAGSPPAARAAAATGPADTAGLDTLVALGEKVFKGRVGGAICTTCHGANAKGLKRLGPDLTDGTWLHGDGSRAFIRNTIRTGVPKPKEAGAPMPPYGGTPLKAEYLDALVAYVYSLSH